MEVLACSAPQGAPRVHCRPSLRRARLARSASLHVTSPHTPRRAVAVRAQQQEELRVAVVGDLHLDPGPQMELFYEARGQLKAALCDVAGKPLNEVCVVQLGDLGAYAAQPGSQACFDLAKEFLRRVPWKRGALG